MPDELMDDTVFEEISGSGEEGDGASIDLDAEPDIVRHFTIYTEQETNCRSLFSWFVSG